MTIVGDGTSPGKKLYLAQKQTENGVGVGWNFSLLDAYSEKVESWTKIMYPGNRSGLVNCSRPFRSADGKAFAYSCAISLSQLYIVENAR